MNSDGINIQGNETFFDSPVTFGNDEARGGKLGNFEDANYRYEHENKHLGVGGGEGVIGKIDLDKYESVLKSEKNIRKLTQDLKVGDTDQFLNRFVHIVLSSASAAEQQALKDLNFGLVTTTFQQGEILGKYNETVTNKIDNLGALADSVNDLVKAYNNSTQIYNELVQISAAKEQATQLLNIILKCGRDNMDALVLHLPPPVGILAGRPFEIDLRLRVGHSGTYGKSIDPGYRAVYRVV